MDTSTITALSQALDLGSARLQAISNNLSNVNTPGFKRQDATFAALLQSAGGRATICAGHPGPARPDVRRHGPRRVRPDLRHPAQGQMRADGNNVDIDAETSRLAAAEIYYQGASQLLTGQFASLKYAIAGGR